MKQNIFQRTHNIDTLGLTVSKKRWILVEKSRIENAGDKIR